MYLNVKPNIGTTMYLVVYIEKNYVEHSKICVFSVGLGLSVPFFLILDVHLPFLI